MTATSCPPNQRQREWWYARRRKLPTGMKGRPRSLEPPAVRRQQSREKYAARLAERGLVAVRLLLPAAAAERLHRLAEARGQAPGELVAELLPCATDSPVAISVAGSASPT
jgi:hypothetical protein